MIYTEAFNWIEVIQCQKKSKHTRVWIKKLGQFAASRYRKLPALTVEMQLELGVLPLRRIFISVRLRFCRILGSNIMYLFFIFRSWDIIRNKSLLLCQDTMATKSVESEFSQSNQTGDTDGSEVSQSLSGESTTVTVTSINELVLTCPDNIGNWCDLLENDDTFTVSSYIDFSVISAIFFSWTMEQKLRLSKAASNRQIPFLSNMKSQLYWGQIFCFVSFLTVVPTMP